MRNNMSIKFFICKSIQISTFLLGFYLALTKLLGPRYELSRNVKNKNLVTIFFVLYTFEN